MAAALQTEETSPPMPGRTEEVAGHELLIKEARRRHRRRVMVPFGIVLILAAGALATAVIVGDHPSRSPSGSTATTPRAAAGSGCAAGQLHVSLGDNLAGAGSCAFVIVFDNAGTVSCRLKGYARLVGVGPSGALVGSTRHSPATGATRVPVREATLSPGHAASVYVETAGIRSSTGTCVTYTALLVAPPGATHLTRVTLKWRPGQGPLTNGLSACGPLWEAPVVAGVPTFYSPSPSQPTGLPATTVAPRGPGSPTPGSTTTTPRTRS